MAKEASRYCIKIPNTLFFLLLYPTVLEVILMELKFLEFLGVHRVHRGFVFSSPEMVEEGERLQK